MKKKAPAKRRPSPPRLIDTNELCKDLVAMAGFIEDKRVQDKIYKRVRHLQLLDKAASDAGSLPLLSRK